MNRILFEPGEIRDGAAEFGGDRARHVAEILHGEPGQTLKTGILDGPVGTSEILSVERDGDGWRVAVRTDHHEASAAPWVDLVLAPPRPRVLKRLLPQLAALGVGKIVLVGAKKVEKDFWGATLLKPETYRPLLVDGLMQAGTSAVPTIETRRAFRRFAADEMDSMFPPGERIVAHPYEAGRDAGNLGGEAVPDSQPASRLLLAIGPEGGWTDDEVELLASKGFRRYSLGKRILRTDTAAVALLARLAEGRDNG